jgi:hypothetical protein
MKYLFFLYCCIKIIDVIWALEDYFVNLFVHKSEFNLVYNFYLKKAQVAGRGCTARSIVTLKCGPDATDWKMTRQPQFVFPLSLFPFLFLIFCYKEIKLTDRKKEKE